MGLEKGNNRTSLLSFDERSAEFYIVRDDFPIFRFFF